MSVLSRFKNEIQDENWITEQIYFNKFRNQEYRRQLFVLVKDGFLHHTPFLLYLAGLIEKRFEQSNKRSCLIAETEINKNVEVPFNTEPIVLNNMADDTITKHSETSVVINNTIHRLAQLVEAYGTIKRVETDYIAKKMLFESGQDSEALIKDIDIFEFEFYQALSKIKRTKKKRCRSKNKKRGGKKNNNRNRNTN